MVENCLNLDFKILLKNNFSSLYEAYEEIFFINLNYELKSPNISFSRKSDCF